LFVLFLTFVNVVLNLILYVLVDKLSQLALDLLFYLPCWVTRQDVT